MAQVVLAVLIVFDIFPFEVAAAAAGDVVLACCAFCQKVDGGGKWGCVPAAFFADACYEIHCLSEW